MTNIFASFRATPKNDIRWSGPVRYGPYLLVPITGLVLLYLIFTIVNLVYSGVKPGYFTHGSYTWQGRTESYENWNANTPVQWNAGAGTAAGEVLSRLTPLIIEAIHIPLHTRAFLRGTLNPIATLSVSCIFTSMWVVVAAMDSLQDFSLALEIEFTDDDHVWGPVAFLRIALAAALAVCYLAMMCFAAPAVHYDRLEIKGRGRGKRESMKLNKGRDEVDVELGDVTGATGKV